MSYLITESHVMKQKHKGRKENGFIGKRIVNFEIGHNLQKAKIVRNMQ